MADVVFVFSNPRHHLEMMAPVAEELGRRGVRCSLVSLAELRGFDTPAQSGAQRAIPINLRRRNSSGRTAKPRPKQPLTPAAGPSAVTGASASFACASTAGASGATASATAAPGGSVDAAAARGSRVADAAAVG